jgi:hypothetical protein
VAGADDGAHYSLWFLCFLAALPLPFTLCVSVGTQQLTPLWQSSSELSPFRPSFPCSNVSSQSRLRALWFFQWSHWSHLLRAGWTWYNAHQTIVLTVLAMVGTVSWSLQWWVSLFAGPARILGLDSSSHAGKDK